MNPEPGWYYAQGDPPGTVRRWNGTQWIGFPIAPPGAEPEGTGASAGVGVEPFRPIPGMVSLKAIAIIVQLAFIGLAACFVFNAVTMFQAGSYVSGDRRIMPPQSFVERMALSTFATLLGQLIVGALFLIWFFLAYRNLSLWHKTRRSTASSIYAWFVPFMNLIRPLSMMLELIERSPRDDKQGDFSPVPAIVWWFVWIVPGIIFSMMVARDLSQQRIGLLNTLGFSSIVSLVAIGLIIYIIQQVTDAQESRRRPSAAQRALLQREAEIVDFKQQQTQTTGTVF